MRGAIIALGVAACLAPTAAAAQEAVYDPWEGFNRDLYAVHDAVDQAVLEPVARGYRAVVPGPARGGVRNFLRNLRGPVIFVNDVLQAEPSRAGTTAARFGINTTIGVLGIFDPATHFGLERHDEDFGQTLAVWGVGEGPYIFVPVLGPTNLRDGVGRVVDIAFDPLTWAEFDHADEARSIRTVVSGVDAREGVLDAVDDVRETSIDPYVTFRTTYGTLRRGQILNGDIDTENLPDFDENYDSDDAAPSESSPPAAAPPSDAAPPAASSPTAEDNQQHSEAIQLSYLTAQLEGVGDAPTSALHTGETK